MHCKKRNHPAMNEYRETAHAAFLTSLVLSGPNTDAIESKRCAAETRAVESSLRNMSMAFRASSSFEIIAGSATTCADDSLSGSLPAGLDSDLGPSSMGSMSIGCGACIIIVLNRRVSRSVVLRVGDM